MGFVEITQPGTDASDSDCFCVGKRGGMGFYGKVLAANVYRAGAFARWRVCRSRVGGVYRRSAHGKLANMERGHNQSGGGD